MFVQNADFPRLTINIKINIITKRGVTRMLHAIGLMLSVFLLAEVMGWFGFLLFLGAGIYIVINLR